ncbi:toxin co-regulated pilus biosynthesis Q family protein [Yersinia massiliensis]|uniref:toxin co-regulated pilus biosynthesis Q family protein n=1 Tax=Yersinia massiliensis TaxID=419257 RepID=UPI0002D4246B|nr:toxin co-regulated pilus biosynthesis Q family protein [Yersinia massiliensis]MCB5309626.1 toxin co-regulated pilus biosynthesis Q family protein [Yersinia massiliensis]
MQYKNYTLLALSLCLSLVGVAQAQPVNTSAQPDTNTRFLQPEKKTSSMLGKTNMPSQPQMIQPKPVFQQKQPTPNTAKASTYTYTAPEKTWQIIRGTDLRAQLDSWSTAAGWSLVWDSEYSYLIQANASFKGDYISAVKQLFTALGDDVNPNLYPELYQGNFVLKVSNQAR